MDIKDGQVDTGEEREGGTNWENGTDIYITHGTHYTNIGSVQFSSVTNTGGVYQYTLTMETVRYFIFPGSKITADGDHSHEIKRHLLLGRKAMTNLDSILKSRDTTLLTKVHLVNAMVPRSHVWM